MKRIWTKDCLTNLIACFLCELKITLKLMDFQLLNAAKWKIMYETFNDRCFSLIFFIIKKEILLFYARIGIFFFAAFDLKAHQKREVCFR